MSMYNKTESLFCGKESFLQEHDLENPDEEAQQKLIAFLNGHQDMLPELDAFDYLDMARQATSKTKTIQFAQKALQLDPTLIDAKFLILSKQAKNVRIFQSGLEGLLKEEADHLQKQGITEEKTAGEYYHILETRPYLRLLAAYVDVMISQGKMRRAVEICKKICYLNEADNMGVRFTLMALYAYLEEPALAEELYCRYQTDNCYTLLPMIAMYYKLEDTEKAVQYLERLCSWNHHVKKAVQILKKEDEYELMQIADTPYFSPGSWEEVIIAYMDNIFLYGELDDFLNWITERLPKKTTAVSKQKKSQHK